MQMVLDVQVFILQSTDFENMFRINGNLYRFPFGARIATVRHTDFRGFTTCLWTRPPSFGDRLAIGGRQKNVGAIAK